MAQTLVRELFRDEGEQQDIRIFAGGLDKVNTLALAIEESEAITYCFDEHIRMLEWVSPKLAAYYRNQRNSMVKWGMVAKGSFPEEKSISYPGVNGGIGVDFLAPQTYRYKDTATSTDPCYSAGYAVNTTNLTLVADTTAYIAGDGTYYYKGKPTDTYHSMNVLFQNGIVEFNTSPKIQLLKFRTNKVNKYAPIAAPMASDQSIEEGKMVYPYITPGQIPMMHTHGVEIAVLPHVAGTADVRYFGMVFFEFDFLTLAARA
jgi:hypothetical protein